MLRDRKLWDGRPMPFYSFTFLDDYTDETKEEKLWDAWRHFEDDTYQIDEEIIFELRRTRTLRV